MDQISPVYKIKCLFAGETSVGKSSMVSLFRNNFHDPTIEPTIGMGFAATSTVLEEYNLDKNDLPKFYLKEKNHNYKQIVKAHHWDAAGSMRFRSIVKSYTRDLDIVFLVFSLNDYSSWQALPKWKEEIDKSNKYDSIPMYVLIGTKSDLRPYHVPDYEIQSLCAEWNVKRYIISNIQKNSADLVRSLLYKTIKDYHQHILDLKESGQEIPEHITLEYNSKQTKPIDLDVESGSKFCCFQ